MYRNFVKYDVTALAILRSASNELVRAAYESAYDAGWNDAANGKPYVGHDCYADNMAKMRASGYSAYTQNQADLEYLK